MKVYVLTTGRHYNNGIVGVYSSLDLAQEARARRGDADDDDPEEYELDLMDDQPEGDLEAGPVFQAVIRLKDGSFRSISGPVYYAYRHSQECQTMLVGLFADSLAAPHRLTEGKEPTGILVWSPVSPEHAVEVAIERRHEWLRAQLNQSAGE